MVRRGKNATPETTSRDNPVVRESSRKTSDPWRDEAAGGKGTSLGSVARSLKGKQIHLVLTEVAPAVRAELGRYELTDAIPSSAMYDTVGEVVKAYEAASGRTAHPRTRVDSGSPRSGQSQSTE